jgi:AcrR family transcriptional regulator
MAVAPLIDNRRGGARTDMIVDAAIAVADADGMARLSMRAVGDRLGRTAMALYTFVPNKSELVDLMHDRALAELRTDYDLGVGWRAAATSWAHDHWAFYLRHPWVLQVSQARPVLGLIVGFPAASGGRLHRNTCGLRPAAGRHLVLSGARGTARLSARNVIFHDAVHLSPVTVPEVGQVHAEFTPGCLLQSAQIALGKISNMSPQYAARCRFTCS